MKYVYHSSISIIPIYVPITAFATIPYCTSFFILLLIVLLSFFIMFAISVIFRYPVSLAITLSGCVIKGYRSCIKP